MQNQWKISFENIGASSYLAVTFPPETEVIGYQMEMITSNEIRHVLKVSRRMINGQTAVYYNISSKIQLSRILERRKLKREELLALIQGALDAVKDGKEYQLSEKGFLMDPEYIYVEPDTCSPYFLYIPAKQQGENGIQKFLTSLIMRGQIEMSNDNLIQVLLEVLNRQPFSLVQLEDCIGKLQGKKMVSGPSLQPPSGVMGGTPVSWNRENCEDREKKPEPEMPVKVQETETREPEPEAVSRKKGLPGKPERRKPERAEKPGKKKEKKEKKAQESTPDEEEKEFDREKARKKFLLPQAAVMILLAALISFGAFTDGEGKIVLNNVLAAVLITAVAEIILYREAYVNGKEKSGEKQKKAEKKKTEKKKGRKPSPASVPVPEEKDSRRPPVPSEEKRQAVSPAEPLRPAAEEIPHFNTVPHVPEFSYAKEPVFRPVPDEVSSETELWEGDSDEGAYLEYYVNGVLSRVMLNKPSTLVGRLSGQVDFAVSNPKVGKIHAEFLNQNGAIYVKDLNSKNGTYINRSGQRINSNIPYPLKDNDRISLADSDFTLRCSQR